MVTTASPATVEGARPGTAHNCRFHLSVIDGNRDALREREALPAECSRFFSLGGRRSRAPSRGFSGAFGNHVSTIPGIPVARLRDADSIPGRAGGGEPGSCNGTQERDPAGKPAGVIPCCIFLRGMTVWMAESGGAG